MAKEPYQTVQWRKLRPVIYERDRGVCQICGGRIEGGAPFDIDHIVPWSEGGAWFDPGNLRLACPPCNRARSSKRMKLAADINRTPAPAPSRDW